MIGELIFVFVIVAIMVFIIGQKWKKDSIREEKDNQRFFDYEDDWLQIHRD